jgi:hypothetical protein
LDSVNRAAAGAAGKQGMDGAMRSVSIDLQWRENKLVKVSMTAVEYAQHLIDTAPHYKNGCIMPEPTSVKWFGQTYAIYRFIYAALKGNIPPHTLVMHSCDNNPCINPDHLVLGTHSQNSRDAKIRGRSNFIKAYNHVRYGTEA